MRESRSSAVIIPARLGARRFPRKVLACQTGKYLLQHVWERVVGCPVVRRTIVATDSEEVVEAARSFGAEVRLTSPEHRSGTDRVAEVARDLQEEIIVNVQADEPLITHGDLERLIALFDPEPATPARPADMTTLVVARHDEEGFRDPDIVKAVIACDGRALYFTRAPAPYAWIGSSGGEDGESGGWWQHVGIYGYRREFLLRFPELEPTPLERRERLEQLRALEHGFTIRAGVAEGRRIGIDTPEEYRRFVAEYLAEGTSAVAESSEGVGSPDRESARD